MTHVESKVSMSGGGQNNSALAEPLSHEVLHADPTHSSLASLKPSSYKPAFLAEVIIKCFKQMGELPFTEDEMRDRILRLPSGREDRKVMIKFLETIFFYNPELPSLNTRVQKTPILLLDLRTEEEIIKSRKKRKETLLQRTRHALEWMLDKLTMTEVHSAIRKLSMYIESEMAAETNDALELYELQRLARPHVMNRQTACYVCIFCNIEFGSIAGLQAHLISLKHHFIRLPANWIDAIEIVRDYEIKTAMNRGGGGVGATVMELKLTETDIKPKDHEKSDPRRKNKVNHSPKFGKNASNPTDICSIKDDPMLDSKNTTRNASKGSLQANRTTRRYIKGNSMINLLRGVEIMTNISNVMEEPDDERRRSGLHPMTANYTNCLFCSKKVDAAATLEGHVCTDELEDFIEQEINHYNINGSPLVCLLCDCRPFESPEAMMIHAVGQHCHDATPEVCPLCEVSLSPDDSEPTRCESSVQRLVLDRHLQQVHLPQLEILGRMFHSFGDTIATKTLLNSATTMDCVNRSYRCCFQAGRAAGEGPAFPFEHWRSHRSHRAISENRMHRSDSTLPRGILQRPSRDRARRACLYDPRDLYLSLRAEWFRSQAATHTSIYAILAPPASTWCSHSADSMPKLLAHVIGCHGGNPYLQPGLREMVQNARHGRRAKRHSALDVWNETLLNNGLLGHQQAGNSGETLGNSEVPEKKMLPVEMATSTTKALNDKIGIGQTPGNAVYTSIAPDNPVKNEIYEKSANRFKQTFNVIEHVGLSCQPQDERVDSATNSVVDSIQGESHSTAKQIYARGKESTHTLTETSYKFSKLPSKFSTLSSNLRKRTGVARQEPQSRSKWRQLLPSTSGQQGKNESTFCRLCLGGPFANDISLNEHLEKHHLGAYMERVIRVKKRGTFAQAVDPMRTCFQCYRVVESFIALQVHMICAHNSLYPLVCGLCHMPFTNQGCADIKYERKLIDNLKLAAEKAENRVREYFEVHGYLKEVDIMELLPQVDIGASASTIYQTVHTGLERAIHVEEIREVRSAVLAGHASLQLPAAFLLQAIRSHERKHVQQMRDAHFELPTFIANNEESIRSHHERLRKLSMPMSLIEFSAGYRELNNARMDYEYQTLLKLVNSDAKKPINDYRKTIQPIAMSDQRKLWNEVEACPRILPLRVVEYFKQIASRPNLDFDL